MSRRRSTDEAEESRDAPNGDVERPLRADARRNRDAVVAAARKLFEQRGVGVEMDEIARKAGVGVGTIYRHFPTKESLIQAVAASFLDRLIEAAEERADADDPGAAFLDYLAIVGDEFAAKYSLGHAITLSPAAVAEGLKRREAFRTAIEALLTRAKKAGDVRQDVTVDDLMLLLKGSLAGGEQGKVEPAARRRMLEIICDGLRPKGERKSARG